MNSRVHPPHHEQDSLPGLEAGIEAFAFDILDDIPGQPGEELRYNYVAYTERLISGVIKDKVDTLVFLDKSARPVSWLMKELWPTLGVDDNGDPLPMPEIKFVNIDREQWSPLIGRSEVKTGRIDLSNIHPDTIDSLRGLFAHQLLEHDEYVPEDAVTMFDDKHVRIIDEVQASGDTLRMATGIFRRAFPEAEISGAPWMKNPIRMDPQTHARYNVVPVWYKDDDMYGRGVGERKINASLHSKSMNQRRGREFLSTRLPRYDADAAQLRQEFKVLAAQVKNGLMPVTPDPDREDPEGFIERVNGVTIHEFMALKHEAERSRQPFAAVFMAYKLDSRKPSTP